MPSSPAKRPLVDVIVLSWNRVDMTVAAIESALAQQGVDIRIQVLDQGSRPETVERLRALAAAHPQVHLEELPENIGVASGRNVAARLGSAPILVGLDNDAEFASPDELRKAVDVLAAHSRVAVLSFRVLNFSSRELDEGAWVYGEDAKARSNAPFVAAKFTGGGFAFRRSVWKDLGGFDDRLFFNREELELSYRVIAAGYLIRYDPAVTILHKQPVEARIDWSNGRWYLFVRNGLYVHLKHHGIGPSAAGISAAWMLKGFHNRLYWESLRGVAAGARMYARARHDLPAVDRDARKRVRAYFEEHDARHRGGLVHRLRNLVFQRLPGT